MKKHSFSTVNFIALSNFQNEKFSTFGFFQNFVSSHNEFYKETGGLKKSLQLYPNLKFCSALTKHQTIKVKCNKNMKSLFNIKNS